MEHDCCKQKHESIGKQKNEKTNTKNMMNYVVVGVLALLLIFSIVQAVQLGNVSESISGGAVSSVSTQTSTSSPQTKSTPQTSAPTMVGGC